MTKTKSSYEVHFTLDSITLMNESGYENKDFNFLIAAWNTLLNLIDKAVPTKEDYKHYTDLKICFHRGIDLMSKKECYDAVVSGIAWLYSLYPAFKPSDKQKELLQTMISGYVITLGKGEDWSADLNELVRYGYVHLEGIDYFIKECNMDKAKALLN